MELKEEIRSRRHIHGPVKSGDCIACHDPHGAERGFLLREPYSKLCRMCHNPLAYMSGAFVHKPAQDGNCGICHDPHASNQRFRLTDIGANLCLSCHTETIEMMTLGYTHTPLVESGCSDCHDPHSGNDKLRLRTAPEQICFSCHKAKKDEIDHSTYRHEPAFEGKCTFCHSPHASSTRELLHSKIDTLCYSCHKEASEWKTMKFQHGPVLQGNCTACHDPHGSDNPYILRLPFPEKFYTQYEDGKYSLCFLCHAEAMITVEQTETITSFRNGGKNLHAFHVKQKKGRTCRACHDVHASNEERHMREEFRFGKINIPLYYFKTTSGGRCIPGCHKERAYDRVNAIINEN
jgi:predicted CXXCH cytochrome family protein